MYLSTDPDCDNCGHKWSQHYHQDSKGSKAWRFVTCQVKRARGWNEQTRSYASYEKCECPGWRGPARQQITVSPETCPHELQKDSRRCCICNRVVPKKASR